MEELEWDYEGLDLFINDWGEGLIKVIELVEVICIFYVLFYVYKVILVD